MRASEPPTPSSCAGLTALCIPIVLCTPIVQLTVHAAWRAGNGPVGFAGTSLRPQRRARCHTMLTGKREFEGGGLMDQKDLPRCRVAIVEDHMLQRIRTEELLRGDGSFEIVFSGESAPDFVHWVRGAAANERPHLLLLDLMVDRRPSVEVELVERLLAAGLRILVFSALASPVLVRKIVRAGVTGVVGKRDTEADILTAAKAAARGESWVSTELAVIIAGDSNRPSLSIQEERALVFYASGLTLDEVGAAMNISRETAKQYLDRVKKKYSANGVEVRTKLDFGRIAWVDGYLDPAAPAPGDG